MVSAGGKDIFVGEGGNIDETGSDHNRCLVRDRVCGE